MKHQGGRFLALKRAAASSATHNVRAYISVGSDIRAWRSLRQSAAASFARSRRFIGKRLRRWATSWRRVFSRVVDARRRCTRCLRDTAHAWLTRPLTQHIATRACLLPGQPNTDATHTYRATSSTAFFSSALPYRVRLRQPHRYHHYLYNAVLPVAPAFTPALPGGAAAGPLTSRRLTCEQRAIRAYLPRGFAMLSITASRVLNTFQRMHRLRGRRLPGCG